MRQIDGSYKLDLTYVELSKYQTDTQKLCKICL